MSAAGVLAIVGLVVVVTSINLLGPVAGEGGSEAPARSRNRTGRVLRRPPTPLLLLGALGLLAYLVENAWQSWGAVHLHSTLNATVATAAAAPAVFAGCAALGRLAGNRVLRHVPPAGVISAGATIAAGGSVLAALAPNPALALIGIAFAGLGTSVCAPTLISVAGTWAGTQDGVGTAGATSTVVTLSYLGFLVGPALVGLIGSAATLPTALGVVGGIAAVLAVLTPFALRASAPRHTA
jgi:fucose permease